MEEGDELPTQRPRDGQKPTKRAAKAEVLSQAMKQGQEDRALRSAYQNLREQTARDGGDLTNLYAPTLADRLQQSNKLSELVQRPREQAVDSELFANLADAGMSMAKKLTHGGQGVTAKDFLRRLKAKHAVGAQQGGNDCPQAAFDWVALGRSVAPLFRPGVGVSCMVGPLGSKPKMRKTIVRHHKKAALAKLVRPDELQEVDEDEKQETDRHMVAMWAVVKKHRPSVPLLELVLNPHDDPCIGFGQTVENMFGLSFLVRDGKVSLTKERDGVIMVNLVDKKDRPTQETVDRTQFMLNQDFETWKQWKASVRPEDCLMPHRQPQGRNAEAPLPLPNAPTDSDASHPADSASESDGAAAGSASPNDKAKSARRAAASPSDGKEEADAPKEAKKKRRLVKH